MNNFNIEEVIGHVVEVRMTVTGLGGWITQETTKKGRIIFSVYQESLFFMEMGKRNRGLSIELEDIKELVMIRKDKKKHEEYLPIYQNRKQLIADRRAENRRRYEEEEREREERYEREKQEKETKKQREIEEAKALGGFDELEKEITEHYEASGEWWSKETVLNVFLPVVQKLMNKSIDTVNNYPKHYFYKKDNPRFVAFIEKKLNVKLPNTQKGSIEALNNYLNN